MRRELDDSEKRILRALQRNADISINEIAETAALSTASVHRKIRRLKADGIIEKTVAVISGERTGQLSIITLVELDSDRPEILNEYRKSILNEPSIQICHYVTGECDFVMVCSVNSMLMYDQLCERMFRQNKHVKKFRTMVSLKAEKNETGVVI